MDKSIKERDFLLEGGVNVEIEKKTETFIDELIRILSDCSKDFSFLKYYNVPSEDPIINLNLISRGDKIGEVNFYENDDIVIKSDMPGNKVFLDCDIELIDHDISALISDSSIYHCDVHLPNYKEYPVYDDFY